MADSKILGLGELQKTFASLAAGMQKGAARRIAAVGGGVLRKEARTIAQAKGLRKTGALINNIVIKHERDAPAGTEQYNLGVRHGRALGRKYKQLAIGKNGRVRVEYNNNPFYWWYVERGHKIVARNSGQQGGGVTTYQTTLRNGKVVTRTRRWSASSLTGRRRAVARVVAGKPYIEPALQNKNREAIAAMERQALKEVEKARK